MKRILFVIATGALLFFMGSPEMESRRKTPEKLLADTLLDNGVRYYNLLTGSGRNKHSVHVVEFNLLNGMCEMAVVKAMDQVNELDKLHDIIYNYDSASGNKALGAVNANFWRAYSNRPIGPAVIGGEPLEINRYKGWTSGFFDEISRLHIDTFDIEALIIRGRDTLRADYVNRRHDSLDLVIYNKFAGDSVPYVSSLRIKKALKQAFKDNKHKDLTENDFDTLQLMETIELKQRHDMTEHRMRKAVCRYLSRPVINRPFTCVVRYLDTGTVAVPSDGCVISIGDSLASHLLPRKGDTLRIEYNTNVHKDMVFLNAVCGTPRLVREGKAKHEAYKEGSKSRRFIRYRLPRTAIGTNKTKDKIFLVTIEPRGHVEKNRGANLTQLAKLMKKIGAWDAMNLDGGGSTIMLVDNRNVLYKNSPGRSRKISLGVGVVRKGNSGPP